MKYKLKKKLNEGYIDTILKQAKDSWNNDGSKGDIVSAFKAELGFANVKKHIHFLKEKYNETGEQEYL